VSRSARCSVPNLGRAEHKGLSQNRVVKAIRRGYHNNWIVDNLPAASTMEDSKHVTTKYWQGFPVGYVSQEDDKAYIHNHVNIQIQYHEVETELNRYRVVRFMVQPFSIRHEFDPILDTDEVDIDDDSVLPKVAKITNPIRSCQPGVKEHTTFDMITKDGNHQPQPASGNVLYTYDVIWHENKTLHWASRWDVYLTMDHAVPARVHWLSIANSLIIVFVLSAMIAAILVRNL
jgi:transmembrane 9 superfamily protein 2/4